MRYSSLCTPSHCTPTPLTLDRNGFLFSQPRGARVLFWRFSYTLWAQPSLMQNAVSAAYIAFFFCSLTFGRSQALESSQDEPPLHALRCAVQC